MHIPTHSRALRTTGLVLSLWLAGCSALPSRPAPAERYDLGLVELSQLAPAAATPRTAPVPLVLAEVQAPGLTDGMTAMLYRLRYADGQQLRAYQQARWSQPPAQMLEQRLRTRLGLERPVLSERDDISFRAPDSRMLATLKVELDEFSQVFDSVSTSHVVVRVRASLIARDVRTGGNVLQGQKILTAQLPATTADAPGGAKAMALAVDDVAAQLSLWLQDYGR